MNSLHRLCSKRREGFQIHFLVVAGINSRWESKLSSLCNQTFNVVVEEGSQLVFETVGTLLKRFGCKICFQQRLNVQRKERMLRGTWIRCLNLIDCPLEIHWLLFCFHSSFIPHKQPKDDLVTWIKSISSIDKLD